MSPKAGGETARNKSGVEPEKPLVESTESQIGNLIKPGLASPIASVFSTNDPTEWLDQFTGEPLSSVDVNAADLSIAPVQLMDFSLDFDHEEDDSLQQTNTHDNHWDVAQISMESPRDSSQKSGDQFIWDLYQCMVSWHTTGSFIDMSL